MTGSLLVTNRAQLTVEWNGAPKAHTEEVARVAVGDHERVEAVVATGAPLAALLARFGGHAGVEEARELAGEGIDVEHQLEVGHRLVGAARELLGGVKPHILVSATAVDVVAHGSSCAPRIARRRNARVSVGVPAVTGGTSVEAKKSVCVVGTLDDVGAGAVEQAVEEVTAQAARLAESTPTPAWRGAVVFSPEAAGIVVHEAIGHAVEADNYTRLIDPLGGGGQQWALTCINVLETGSIPGQWGSVGVDDEGVETRKMELVVGGRVAGLITDTTWARRLCRRSSGRGRRAWDPSPVLPRLSRVELLPGEERSEDLVGGAGDALHVDSISFGGFDARTGVVKLVVREAHRLRTGACHAGGIIEEPAAALLSKIVAIGDDVSWHPSLCLKRGQVTPAENAAPTMLLSSLDVRPG